MKSAPQRGQCLGNSILGSKRIRAPHCGQRPRCVWYKAIPIMSNRTPPSTASQHRDKGSAAATHHARSATIMVATHHRTTWRRLACRVPNFSGITESTASMRYRTADDSAAALHIVADRE